MRSGNAYCCWWILTWSCGLDFIFGKFYRFLLFHEALNWLQYAERLPIGLERVIRTVSPETVKNFYKKWYHLCNMAVIAVGDFPDAQVLYFFFFLLFVISFYVHTGYMTVVWSRFLLTSLPLTISGCSWVNKDSFQPKNSSTWSSPYTNFPGSITWWATIFMLCWIWSCWGK